MSPKICQKKKHPTELIIKDLQRKERIVTGLVQILFACDRKPTNNQFKEKWNLLDDVITKSNVLAKPVCFRQG